VVLVRVLHWVRGMPYPAPDDIDLAVVLLVTTLAGWLVTESAFSALAQNVLMPEDVYGAFAEAGMMTGESLGCHTMPSRSGGMVPCPMPACVSPACRLVAKSLLPVAKQLSAVPASAYVYCPSPAAVLQGPQLHRVVDWFLGNTLSTCCCCGAASCTADSRTLWAVRDLRAACAGARRDTLKRGTQPACLGKQRLGRRRSIPPHGHIS
jgi:hypothetical protein